MIFSLQKCKHTESDKLSVQIQAYLDNVFDVGGLLEDAETKNVALEKVEELEDQLSHVRSEDHRTFNVLQHLYLCLTWCVNPCAAALHACAAAPCPSVSALRPLVLRLLSLCYCSASLCH